MNTYIPNNINGVDVGDYFYVQLGNSHAGESHVMTAPEGPVIIGFDNLTFTEFSRVQVYSANTQAGLVLNGTVFSAKVDNDTTAFDPQGNIIVKASANLVTPNIGDATGTTLTLTGNIDVGNVISNGVVSATGNIEGNNAVIANNIDTATVVATGNIDAANLNASTNVTAVTVTASGNVEANNATITNNVDLGETLTANNATITNDIGANNLSVTNEVDSNNFTATGTVTTPNVTSVSGLTITTGSDGNIVLNPDGTGVIILEDETADRMLFTGANKEIATDANATFDGANLVITGSVTVDDVIIDGSDITSNTGELTVNNAGSDINFRVAGDNVANLLVTDAGTDTVLINTGAAIANATLQVGGTASLLVPVGTTGERPNPPTTGMVRFNTSINSLEFYDQEAWTTAGSEFTIIAYDDFLGDGACTTFTLSQESTTAGAIVTINGIVQIPVTAYSITNDSLVFTEAPSVSDFIDVRMLTTTNEVKAISNATGNAVVSVTDTANDVIITGDIVPIGNGTANIGSPTNTFDTVFAKATSAQYADLAEMYEADNTIEPGTVVCFGGDKEITVCDVDMCARVAGVISTNPSYLMNSTIEGEHVAPVALTGRVPVRVVGTVRKGDMMVSAGNGAARAETNPVIGSVIGKALENFDGSEGVIEVVVGRL